MTVELPGFFDLQVNGFAGVDFNDPAVSGEAIAEALERQRATGVTRCLPTLITSSLEEFSACARAVTASRHPAVAGIHMEGPYISPEDGARGAHRRACVVPASIDDFNRRQDVCHGGIRLVTLAPEVAGALALIEHLVETGVRAAIGHTAASPAQIGDAVKAGATLATHLGNGCPQMLPRHPNVMWELLAADEVHASLIVDGHHLPASTVKAMMRAKSLARTILVTDAIAAAGCAPGRFAIGEVTCELSEDGRVSLPGTPYLAGSALTMNKAVQNSVRFAGVTLEEAAAMASSNPAKFVGLETVGTITADWDAERLELRVISSTDSRLSQGEQEVRRSGDQECF
jgi:N-acetylglucosamine-6-phosphate deacetylase